MPPPPRQSCEYETVGVGRSLSTQGWVVLSGKVGKVGSGHLGLPVRSTGNWTLTPLECVVTAGAMAKSSKPESHRRPTCLLMYL